MAIQINTRLAAFILCGIASTIPSPAFSVSEEVQRNLELIADGHKRGNQVVMNQGVSGLERLANNGNADAAWNLSAFHLFDLPGKPPNKVLQCKWGLKAAQMGAVDAYFTAADCSKTMGKNAVDSFVNYQIPWIRKIASSGTAEDKEWADGVLREYELALQESRRPAGKLSLGAVLKKLDDIGRR
jgi:hypothetical protein